jgi:hypothetical protein
MARGAFETAWRWLLPQSRKPTSLSIGNIARRRRGSTPCGKRLQVADTDARRAVAMLLRCGDRYCRHRATRLHGADGGARKRMKFVESDAMSVGHVKGTLPASPGRGKISRKHACFLQKLARADWHPGPNPVALSRPSHRPEDRVGEHSLVARILPDRSRSHSGSSKCNQRYIYRALTMLTHHHVYEEDSQQHQRDYRGPAKGLRAAGALFGGDR